MVSDHSDRGYLSIENAVCFFKSTFPLCRFLCTYISQRAERSDSLSSLFRLKMAKVMEIEKEIRRDGEMIGWWRWKRREGEKEIAEGS